METSNWRKSFKIHLCETYVSNSTSVWNSQIVNFILNATYNCIGATFEKQFLIPNWTLPKVSNIQKRYNLPVKTSAPNASKQAGTNSLTDNNLQMQYAENSLVNKCDILEGRPHGSRPLVLVIPHSSSVILGRNRWTERHNDITTFTEATVA